MTKKIKVMFWDKANFGDALSPYIVNRLSGRAIIKKDLYHGFLFAVRCFYGYSRRKMFYRLGFATWPWEKNLMAVGSILKFANSKSKVWGSGFMGYEEKYKDVGEIFAVRGPLSAEIVRKTSGKNVTTYGDPAILLPLLVKPSTLKYDIGIIPHIIETDLFREKYSSLKNGDNVRIIDLRTYDIVEIIKEITSCRMILSSSLHGIIVSHAYGIPALWIKNNLKNADFKFYDYFLSVGIKPYSGFENVEEILLTTDTIKYLFKNNFDIALPKTNLMDLQKKLLQVAPFELLDDYKNYI